MRIDKRGRVTISKDIRERLGLGPGTEVEFRVVRGDIVLQISQKWKGRCKRSMKELGHASVDRLIEDIRGR